MSPYEGRTLAAVIVCSTMLCFARGQATNAPTNFIATPKVLFMTSHSNLVVISKAVEVASGLRPGMKETEVGRYLERHGMPGMKNLYSASVDRGRTWYTFYPLAGECSLALQMRNNQVTSNRLVLPANKVTSGTSSGESRVLERAFIWSKDAEIMSVTFTNGP